MNYGFNFGFSGGDNGKGNVCLTTIGVSGTVIGFDTDLGIGSSDPIETEDGIFFYAFTWDYPATSGSFTIKFGLDGKEQISASDSEKLDKILVTDSGRIEAFIATWDEVLLCYTAKNLTYAAVLNQKYDNGLIPPWCYNMFAVPNKFIEYDFKEINTGELI